MLIKSHSKSHKQPIREYKLVLDVKNQKIEDIAACFSSKGKEWMIPFSGLSQFSGHFDGDGPKSTKSGHHCI